LKFPFTESVAEVRITGLILSNICFSKSSAIFIGAAKREHLEYLWFESPSEFVLFSISAQ